MQCERKDRKVGDNMENRYPLFAGGRILKKEALWDMRDYAYGSMQLQYMDYTDGIVKGCNVRVEGNCLIVGRGMLKYGDFLYLLQEEARIPFAAKNRTVVLKAIFTIKAGNPDYLSYQVDFLLDQDVERQENQIEICRFHLREGSALRDIYTDFADMNTEYDTVNLLYATVSGRGQGRLHPKILLQFAKEMQGHDKKSIEDVAFYYHILQQSGEVERKVVEAYLQGWQTEKEEGSIGNVQCFKNLEGILSGSGHDWGNRQKERIIFVE